MDISNNPAGHHRRSIRLQGYNYTQAGAYFITICTHNRIPLFGEINGNEMRLNDAGRAVRECWKAIPDHYPHAEIDAFIVMPNHMHGIIVITHTPAGTRHDRRPGEEHAPDAYTLVGARHASPLHRARQPSKGTLGTIVGSYKSAVSKQINYLRRTPGAPVWQRNYYEHVIRNEKSLHDVRQYITHNPAKWPDDPDNPRNASQRP